MDGKTPIDFNLFLVNNASSQAALLAYGVATISLVFLIPVLTIHLITLGVEKGTAGYAFAILAFTFGVGATFMGRVYAVYDRKKVMLTAIATEILALSLIGPVQLLQSDSVTLIFIGLGLNGISIAGVFVPIIPILVDSVQAIIDAD